MAVNRNREDNRPASRRVADDLAGQIERHDLLPGTPLPTYRDLAAQYEVAKNTAVAAVRLLQDRGVVTIKPNSKAVVRDPADDVDVSSELATARDEVTELRAQVKRVSTTLDDLEARLRNLTQSRAKG